MARVRRANQKSILAQGGIGMRKLISTISALVMVLSFAVMPATVVMAEEPAAQSGTTWYVYDNGVFLHTEGAGMAAWQTTQVQSGNVSANLSIPLDYGAGDVAGVITYYGGNLSSINSLSYYYFIGAGTPLTGNVSAGFIKGSPTVEPGGANSTAYGGPRVVLRLDADGNGLPDTFVSQAKWASTTNGTWIKDTTNVTLSPFFVTTELLGYESPFTPQTDWGNLKEIASSNLTYTENVSQSISLGGVTVRGIGISAIFDPADPTPALGPVVAYVDSREVNGTTRDLEPGDIQDAIDSASPGDTILVNPGTYDRFIDIWQPLTVQSATNATVTTIYPTTLPAEVEVAPDQVVSITSGGVKFAGFTVKIDGNGIYDPPAVGIGASGAQPIAQSAPGPDDLQILNNIVAVDNVSNAEGILVNGYPGEVLISNNIVKLGTIPPTSINEGYAIDVYNCGSVTIDSNKVFVNTRDGDAYTIYAYSGDSVKVLGNTIVANATSNQTGYWVGAEGICVNYYSRVQVDGNSVNLTAEGYYAWADGMDISYFDRAQVGAMGNGNTVTVNVTGTDYASGYGPYLYSEYDTLAKVMDNTVDISAKAVDSSEYDELYYSYSYAGVYGIDVWGYTGEAEIGNNRVTVASDFTGTESSLITSTEGLPPEIASRMEKRAEAKAETLKTLGTTLGEVYGNGESYGIEGGYYYGGTLSVHHNVVKSDSKVNVDVVQEEYAYADTYAWSEGIYLCYSLVSVQNNSVVATANITAGATTNTSGSAYSYADCAYAFGVELYDCDDSVVKGNLIDAVAIGDVTAYAEDITPQALAENSVLSRLQSELNVLDETAQETLNKETGTTLIGQPEPLCAYTEGGGAAYGVGINAIYWDELQITDNDRGSGTGAITTSLISYAEVSPEYAEAYGGGLGLGIGINSIYSYSPFIANNGLGEGGMVRGVGKANTTILAREQPMTESTCAEGGGFGIGIGILLGSYYPGDSSADETGAMSGDNYPYGQVVTNNVTGDALAGTLVISSENVSGECAFAKGGSQALGLGIAATGVDGYSAGEVGGMPDGDYHSILIGGNQVRGKAKADTGIGVVSVSSQDPEALGGSRARAVGIWAANMCCMEITGNDPVTAVADAATDIGAFEIQKVQDVGGMGGSTALGLGIGVRNASEPAVEGNNARGISDANATVLAYSQIPLEVGSTLSLANGIGAGLALLDVYEAEVHWNNLVGSGNVTVGTAAVAPFSFTGKFGFGLGAGALTRNVYDESCINYNNLQPAYKPPVLLPWLVMEDFGLLDIYNNSDVNALYNFWGDKSGPSFAGPGTGSGLAAEAPFEMWLSHHIGDLQTNNVGYFGMKIDVERGWNTLSTPIALENAAWGNIRAIGNGLDWVIGYTYDSTKAMPWVQVTDTTNLTPLEGMYLKMKSRDVVFLLTSPGVSAPMRNLTQGQNWYLIGPTPYDESFPFTEAMPSSKALVSLEKTPDGKTGYIQVVSPSIGNQLPWSWVPNMGEPYPMMKGKAYWVFMENPDTLAGFIFTPLPVRMPIAPLTVYTDGAEYDYDYAYLYGELDSLCGYDRLFVSFQWGSQPNMLYNETEPQEMTSTGSFSDYIGGLSSGTTYCFRAKVMAPDGRVAYGSVSSFTTYW